MVEIPDLVGISDSLENAYVFSGGKQKGSVDLAVDRHDGPDDEVLGAGRGTQFHPLFFFNGQRLAPKARDKAQTFDLAAGDWL